MNATWSKLVILAVCAGLLGGGCSGTPSSPNKNQNDNGGAVLPDVELTFPADGANMLVVSESGGSATTTFVGSDDGVETTFTELLIEAEDDVLVTFDPSGRPAVLTMGELEVSIGYAADGTFSFVARLDGVEFARGEDLSTEGYDVAQEAESMPAKLVVQGRVPTARDDFWIRRFTRAAMQSLGVPETRLTDAHVQAHPLHACMMNSEEAREFAAMMNAWLLLGLSMTDADCDEQGTSEADRRRCRAAQSTGLGLSSLMMACGEGIALALYEQNSSCQHECKNDWECDEGWCQDFFCRTEEPANDNANGNANGNDNDNGGDDPNVNDPPVITSFTAELLNCPDCYGERGQGAGSVRLTCRGYDPDASSVIIQIRPHGVRTRVSEKIPVSAQVAGEQEAEIIRILPGVGVYAYECEIFETNGQLSDVSEPVQVVAYPDDPMAGDWDMHWFDCATQASKGWDSLILYSNGEYGFGVAGEHGTWTLAGGQFEANRDPGFFRGTVDAGRGHMTGEVVTGQGTVTSCFEAWRGCVVREGEPCEFN